MIRRISIIIALLAAAIGLCRADNDISVGLVTCYPGADVYELEGHTAIHVRGTVDGERVDWAVNYGLFDFDTPNFVYRFVKGETNYWMGTVAWDLFVASYQRQGRRVVERHIPMDSVQSQRLIALLRENMLPWNRTYRYNYVLDNCATRPLRMIERALDDSIILPQPPGADARDGTFRQVMERYHSHYPWYQFGIDLALGPGIDRPIDARAKAFAPVVLDRQIEGATVGGRPLSDGYTVVNEGADVTLPPTPWYATPMTAACLLLVITICITVCDQRRRRVTRWYDAALYTLYGVAGLILTFLVFVSTHEATSPNYLLMWLNPLALVVPALIWLKKCKKVVISYHFINFALILAMCVLWPVTGQRGNMAFVPLICCDLIRSANYIVINVRERHGHHTHHN